MATAQDIITRALRRIGVLAGEEAANAPDMVESLQIMNDLMFAFPPMGIQYVHTALAAGDTVNVPDEQIRNLTFMVADELADGFGAPISPDLRMDIMNAKSELQAAYLHVNPAVPDRALRRRRPGFFDFARGE